MQSDKFYISVARKFGEDFWHITGYFVQRNNVLSYIIMFIQLLIIIQTNLEHVIYKNV